MKKLDKGVPHELTANQKNHLSAVFSYCMQQQQTISRLDCDVTKSGFCMITSDDQLSGWTERTLKALPKARLMPEKGRGHCLVVCYQFNPL